MDSLHTRQPSMGGRSRWNASRLCRSAAERGIRRLFAHVSLTAQPFFARFGFTVIEERLPLVRNVALRNAVMSKELAAQDKCSRLIRYAGNAVRGGVSDPLGPGVLATFMTQHTMTK